MFKTSFNSALGVAAFSLAAVSVAAAVPVGTVVKGYDNVQGEGEFIYLPGVASCVAGDVVVYDLNPAGATINRFIENTYANSGRPVAVALTNVGAGEYGWFQISGAAITNVIGGTVAGNAMGSPTAGKIGNTANTGDQILGMRISTAIGTPAAGQSYVTMNRPNLQSQLT